jgi:hypothetical protein
VNAGERAARERVEAVYAAVDELNAVDLRTLRMPPLDMESREVLLADLQREVDRNGRGAMLDEARNWLRDGVWSRVGQAPSDPRLAVGMAPLDADQFADVLLALSDAVSVAVAEDLLPPEDAADLADPGRRLLRLEPLAASSLEPEPGASTWEPTADDWAAAAAGPAGVDPDEPMAGTRTMQAAFFGVVGGLGGLAALGIGLAQGEPLLGLLGAAAVAALAWTFATYRPARAR